MAPFYFRLQYHTAWLTALGSMEFITNNKTKPNTAPEKHTWIPTNTPIPTHTNTVKNTLAGPAEPEKMLRCAYERARGARFLHRPLGTCCATFVTKGRLGHALKLSLAAPPLPFISLTNLQHISTRLACDLEEAAGCLSSLSL